MNWAHIHLALNHVPVLGSCFLFLLLIAGLLRRSLDIQRLCLWGFLLLSAISIPIKFTGDFAHDQLHSEPWLDHPVLERHEQAADQATTGIFILGVVAAVGLFLGRKRRSVPMWVYQALLILSLITFGLMARTANLGGQIRHPEIRPKTESSANS